MWAYVGYQVWTGGHRPAREHMGSYGNMVRMWGYAVKERRGDMWGHVGSMTWTCGDTSADMQFHAWTCGDIWKHVRTCEDMCKYVGACGVTCMDMWGHNIGLMLMHVDMGAMNIRGACWSRPHLQVCDPTCPHHMCPQVSLGHVAPHRRPCFHMSPRATSCDQCCVPACPHISECVTSHVPTY